MNDSKFFSTVDYDAHTKTDGFFHKLRDYVFDHPWIEITRSYLWTRKFPFPN